jgi:hypothetical protein
VYSRSSDDLLARHRRGQPARLLSDHERDSLPLAPVLRALPDPDVHARPLSVYEEATRG